LCVPGFLRQDKRRPPSYVVTQKPDVTLSREKLVVVDVDSVVDELRELIAQDGVLLESARGPIPNVAELVAGEAIRGSWWAHPQSHRIFTAINALADSPDIARMRLVNRRITLVHRRLWPALLNLEARFPADAMLVVEEQHTASGVHRVSDVPLASWVDGVVRARAEALDEQAALAMLPGVIRDHMTHLDLP
jgi:hypothetical protein